MKPVAQQRHPARAIHPWHGIVDDSRMTEVGVGYLAAAALTGEQRDELRRQALRTWHNAKREPRVLTAAAQAIQRRIERNQRLGIVAIIDDALVADIEREAHHLGLATVDSRAPIAEVIAAMDAFTARPCAYAASACS
jgi:hypothetical protein